MKTHSPGPSALEGPTMAVTPPRPPAEPPQLTGVNKVLGATSGPTEGNVRSILAIEAMTCAHLLYAMMLVALFMGDAAQLRDFIIATGGALFAFDIGVGQHYFGKRSGEGA